MSRLSSTDPMRLVVLYRRCVEGAAKFAARSAAERASLTLVDDMVEQARHYTGKRTFLAARQRQRTYWANREANARALVLSLPENLREIAEGRSVGIPTLTRSDPQHQLAAYLSGKPVEWRD